MELLLPLEFDEGDDQDAEASQAHCVIHTGPATGIDEKKQPDAKVDCAYENWFQILLGEAVGDF